MAAAQILAVAAGAADSSDVTVAAGSALTVMLKDADGGRIAAGAMVNILLKDDAGQYYDIAQLTSDNSSLVLPSGTWRFSRGASSAACGVFSG